MRFRHVLGGLAFRLQQLVDFLILPAVIALFIIIIIEIGFPKTALLYGFTIKIIDISIVVIFAIDLVFKYLRIRNVKRFLRTCWLDIIAVFPFFLVFRFFEPLLLISGISKEIRDTQLIFHEGLEVSKVSSNIVKEVEFTGEVSRARVITGLFKSVNRTPKFLKALPFFEKPTRKHHLERPKKMAASTTKSFPQNYSKFYRLKEKK